MQHSTQLPKPMIGLHWIIAILMIGSLAFGIYLEELPRSADKGDLIGLHKSFGILVLLLAILRIFNTLRTGFPQPLTPPTTWQSRIASGTHIILLAGTVLMPVSGVMMSVGGGYPVAFFGVELIAKGAEIEWLGGLGHIVHGVGANLIIAAIVLHVVGALKHSLIDKDGTMKRMLGRSV